MIEIVAIIVLGVVCLALTGASILRARADRTPIEWPMAQAIAKSLIKTYQRGKADQAHEPSTTTDEWPGYEPPLKDHIPYAPDEEAADLGGVNEDDVVDITGAPLEE